MVIPRIIAQPSPHHTVDPTAAALAVLTVVNRARTPDEVVGALLSSLMARVHANDVGVALVEAGALRVRWDGAAGRTDGAPVPMTAAADAVLAHPRFLAGVGRWDTDPSAILALQGFVAADLGSVFAVPLRVEGRLVGAVLLSGGTATDRHLVEIVADNVAIVLDKALVQARLQERLDEDALRVGETAHDLRNPLTAVRGFLELLERGAVGPLTVPQAALVRRVLGRVNETAAMATALLADLHAERAPVRLQLLDLSAWLARWSEGAAVELARRKGQEVRLDSARDLPQVQADPMHLGRILDNLVGNASKYAPSGSVITVHVAPRLGGVEVAVSDQGPGLEPQDLQRVFRPFQRGAAVPTAGEPSTGLGLAIVARLVTAHGGRVWAESTPGEGLTVRFSLAAVAHPPNG